MAIQHLISIDRADVQEVLDYLKSTPRLLGQARRRIVNRTAATGRTAMIRRITRVLNVQAGKLRDGSNRYGKVKLVRAFGESATARVEVTGKRMPLSRFGARQVAKGVSYKILKAGGRKTVYGFLARGRRGEAESAADGPGAASGFVGVFKRLGRKRLPIQQLFGPSIPHVAQENPQVLAAVLESLPDTLLKNAQQQVRYILERPARRRRRK